MTVSSPKRKKLSETVHIDLLSDSDVSDSDSDGKFPAVVLKQSSESDISVPRGTIDLVMRMCSVPGL